MVSSSAPGCDNSLMSVEFEGESGLSTPMFSSDPEFILRGVSTSLLLTTEVGPVSYSSG